jgi:hypothetical protein
MKKLIIAIALMTSASAFAGNGTYIVKDGNEYVTCNPNKSFMEDICNATVEPATDLVLTIPSAAKKGLVACDKYGRQAAEDVRVPVINVATGAVTCVGAGFLGTLKGLADGIFGTIGDIFN